MAKPSNIRSLIASHAKYRIQVRKTFWDLQDHPAAQPPIMSPSELGVPPQLCYSVTDLERKAAQYIKENGLKGETLARYRQKVNERNARFRFAAAAVDEKNRESGHTRARFMYDGNCSLERYTFESLRDFVIKSRDPHVMAAFVRYIRQSYEADYAYHLAEADKRQAFLGIPTLARDAMIGRIATIRDLSQLLASITVAASGPERGAKQVKRRA